MEQSRLTRNREFRLRIGIFLENKKFVEETNEAAIGQGPDALRVELNNFADMTDAEVEQNMGLMKD
jgi:hypothetical protein